MPRGRWKWLMENGCNLDRISAALEPVSREKKAANEAKKAEAK